MPLQAVKLPVSRNNVVGEKTVLKLNILETGVPKYFGGEPTIVIVFT